MNTFTNVSLDLFIEEFNEKLKEEMCVHPAFCDTFRFNTFVTFSSTIKSLTKSHCAPLPLYFDSHLSMKSISNKESKLKELFGFMDMNGIGRIDAYEFITPILLVSSGDFGKFWDCVIDNFGVEQKDCISSDEFFYYIDSLFRGLSKILVKHDEDPKDFQPRNLRLDCKDISNIIEILFEKEEFVSKADLKKNAEKHAKFNSFLKYVHEKGSQALTKKPNHGNAPKQYGRR